MTRNLPDHTRLSHENLVRFIEHLGETGNVTLSGQAIGITTTTAYKWYNRSKRDPRDPRYLITDPMGDDPDVSFHDAWNQAKDVSLSPVRDKAMDMATGRHAEPVVFQGQLMYEQDTSQEYRLDPITGALHYPPKLDDLGQPVPLMVHKVIPRMTEFILVTRDPDFRPKQDIDISTQGKPIAVPERVVDMATFLAEFGRKVGE